LLDPGGEPLSSKKATLEALRATKPLDYHAKMNDREHFATCFEAYFNEEEAGSGFAYHTINDLSKKTLKFFSGLVRLFESTDEQKTKNEKSRGEKILVDPQPRGNTSGGRLRPYRRRRFSALRISDRARSWSVTG